MMHAKRFIRRKEDDVVPPKLIQIFWSNVKKTDTCWLWIGRRNNEGYGFLTYNGQTFMAHRVALEIAGFLILETIGCHRCDNPPCVRVDDNHVYPGTHKDNMQDMIQHGRAGGNSFKSGESNARAKLTKSQVEDLRKLHKAGWSAVKLGKQFGIGKSQAHRIAVGQRWKD